jgi:protein TonB
MQKRFSVGTLVVAALFSTAALAQQASPRNYADAMVLATYAPRPQIPAEVRTKHLKGAGVFMAYLRADGTVSRVAIIQSTGQPILDKISLEAFSKWRFKLTTVKRVKIPIRYTGDYPKPSI